MSKQDDDHLDQLMTHPTILAMVAEPSLSANAKMIGLVVAMHEIETGESLEATTDEIIALVDQMASRMARRLSKHPAATKRDLKLFNALMSMESQ
jgi:hypothetical protein